MVHVRLGSVSKGTTNQYILMRRFSKTLENLLNQGPPDNWDETQFYQDAFGMINEAKKLVRKEHRDDILDTQLIHFMTVISALESLLQEYAPPYCYFGAHIANPTNFGFWPDLHIIDDLPTVDTVDEVMDLGTDCKIVNHDGGVKIYKGDGTLLLNIDATLFATNDNNVHHSEKE